MVEKLHAYKALSELLSGALKDNYNLIIVTLPGNGISHYFKTYATNTPESVSYIVDLKNVPALKTQNIIDLSFYTTPSINESIDSLVLGADVSKKFVITIDDPSWLRSQKSANCRFLSRVYKTEFFKIHELEDVKNMLKNFNPKLSSSDISKLSALSGGIARITKYLALNPKANHQNDDQLLQLITPLLSVLSRSTDDELQKFRIKQNGIWASSLIANLLTQQNSIQGFQLSVSPTLLLTEDGFSSSTVVSQSEKEIIEYLVQNDGKITKEKIAEIKWGEGSFDSYSDQAIRKTVVRLNAKLSKYHLRPLSKISYLLIRK